MIIDGFDVGNSTGNTIFAFLATSDREWQADRFQKPTPAECDSDTNMCPFKPLFQFPEIGSFLDLPEIGSVPLPQPSVAVLSGAVPPLSSVSSQPITVVPSLGTDSGRFSPKSQIAMT